MCCALPSFARECRWRLELLVVTLAYTNSGRDADVLARIRLIGDTVRNAPGSISTQFYRSRGKDSYYLLLTTWDSEESWQRANERYNPRHLLLSSATELLTASPEQWIMHYLWGYSRPAATPIIAGAHLAHIPIAQSEVVHQGWIEGLRRQSAQPTLAFAFLAQGAQEEVMVPSQSSLSITRKREQPTPQSAVFLNLLSWANEIDREDFYTDPHFKAIQRFVGGIGTMQTISLEPM